MHPPHGSPANKTIDKNETARIDNAAIATMSDSSRLWEAGQPGARGADEHHPLDAASPATSRGPGPALPEPILEKSRVWLVNVKDDGPRLCWASLEYLERNGERRKPRSDEKPLLRLDSRKRRTTRQCINRLPEVSGCE